MRDLIIHARAGVFRILDVESFDKIDLNKALERFLASTFTEDIRQVSIPIDIYASYRPLHGNMFPDGRTKRVTFLKVGILLKD